MLERNISAPAGGRGRRRSQAGRLAGSKVHIVVGLVCSAYDLTPAQIYRGSRGAARIAFARQVAMYVAHVWLGLSLSEVGRRFGRDRTTVAHACGLVEDRRDDPLLDSTLNVIETAAGAWQDLSSDCGAV
jgi:chromosomal replication initiation ATPase DnaA